jgi:Rrf2 family protein
MYELSKKAKYAIRALVALSGEYGKGPVLIANLARNGAIPKKFLELILLELKNKGFLGSKKGKGGGYFLKKPPRSISIGDVILAIEGYKNPVQCLSETRQKHCDGCEDEDSCCIKLIMQEVSDSIVTILKRESLEDIARKEDQLKQAKAKTLAYSI